MTFSIVARSADSKLDANTAAARVGGPAAGQLLGFLVRCVEDLDSLVAEHAHHAFEGVGGQLGAVQRGRDVGHGDGPAFSGSRDQVRYLIT